VIVTDASVLIAHLDAEDAHHDRAGSLLESLAARPLSASRVTLAEVLVGPARAGKLELAMAALAQLGVLGLGLDPDAPARLAGLRAATGLKLPDCCVLLAAEQVNASIATFDERLAGASRRLGMVVVGS
jgi:predicted nucleic acid-binding protein